MNESDLPCIQSETQAETRVFDGIKLTFENESNASGCDNSDRILEIRHCKSGRAEFLTGDGFIYLSAGDMYAGPQLAGAGYFPTGEYSGVKVTADIEKTPKCLSCFLEDVNVNPENLYEKFKNGYIARSDENTAHIFSEIYNVGGDIKMGYFKVKTLELFLFLSRIDILKSEKRESYRIKSADRAYVQNKRVYKFARRRTHYARNAVGNVQYIPDGHKKRV